MLRGNSEARQSDSVAWVNERDEERLDAYRALADAVGIVKRTCGIALGWELDTALARVRELDPDA